MKLYAIFYLLLFPFRLLLGQSYFPIEHITSKDGLSYRNVNTVIKDSKGFLWVATANGLNRFDGVDWRVYRQPEPGNGVISNNNFQWILEDTTGNLLIIQREGGVCYFNPDTGRFLSASPPESPNDAVCIIGAPFKTNSGDILALGTVSTQEGFYLLEYKGAGRFKKSARLWNGGHPEIPGWYSKYWSPIQFWGGTAEDFWYWDETSYIRFQPSKSSYTHYLFKTDRQINAVNQLLPIDKNGRFWFPGSPQGNGPVFQSVQLPLSIPISDWNSYTFDNHRNIWIKEKNGKVFRYDFRRQRLEEKKEVDFSRFPLEKKGFEDDLEMLWLPHKFGIAKLKKRRSYFENYLNDPDQWNGLSSRGVEAYTIVEDRHGRIFFFSNRIYQFDPNTQKAFPAPWYALERSPLNSSDNYSDFLYGHNCKVMVGNDGFLWINWGIELGLFKYYPETGQYQRFTNPGIKGPKTVFPHAVKEGPAGNLWLTDERLYFFDRKTKTFETKAAAQFPPITGPLLKDGEVMWACTETGLIKINSHTLAFESFDLLPQNGRGFHQFFSMVFHKGLLWMGTNNGLLKFDPVNRVLTTYTTADGLPHNIIYTILADGNNLWLGTHNGLCLFNINTLDVRNYYTENGLTHNEFNRESALKTRDGKMYFGGMNGVNAFYPAVLDSLSKAESTRLVWTRFSKIDGKTDTILSYTDHQINETLPVELGYSDRSFTFHYALLSYSDPSENKYYHYLEGFDKSWNYTGSVSSINYPNLPAGNYTLRVKAKDANGNPGLNELAIPIVVYGPWWNKWWAWLLYIAILASVILGFRKYEMRRLLAQAEARRLKELDRAKTRLYTNITHEFRTPLTVIMGIADNIPGAEQERQLIRRNSQKLLRLVNQMLDLSKLESGTMQTHCYQADIINFLRYLTESFHSVAAEKVILLEFSSEEPELIMDFDEEKIQQVVYNLLSNALKFTPAGNSGKVELLAQKQEENNRSWLQVQVRDTGIGIAEADLPYIFDRFYQADDSHTRRGEGTGIGLALTKELTELMGGSIAVRSAPGMGSTFTALLPITNEAPFALTNTVLTEPDRPLEMTNRTVTGLKAYLPGDKPLLLIVEDNKDVIAYIRTLVENDYQIETAPNGSAGMEMALELVPDIIISDVMMPEMDGYLLTQKLKADERTSHIPVILLTAKAEEQDRLTGLRTGADAYLVKPFNKEELLVRLEKLTELRRQLQLRYAGLAESPACTEVPTSEDSFLQRLIQLVEEHIEDPEFSASQLYTAAHMSQPQLYRKLMALTGKSPALFIRTVRLRKATILLRSTDMTVSEIAWATGFNDPNYFSRAFKEEFGMTPGEYRS